MEEFRWLWGMGPGFAVPGKSITVLHEPTQYYELLKELSRKAQHRIILASLYLGTGELEKDLVKCVAEAARHRQVKVHWLLDCTRGSRGGDQSSRSLLVPLVREFGRNIPGPGQGCMRVSLYHSPLLRGPLRWLLPARWNEVVGLTHLKVYLFDDTLMLSGANLGDQYFVNRQDRYVVFHDCPALANFFAQLVSIVASFSFQLQEDNSLALNSPNQVHPYKGDSKVFAKNAGSQIEALLTPTNHKANTNSSTRDTWVFPLIQAGPFKVTQDQRVTEQLLQMAPEGSKVHLATGYFNLTSRYAQLLQNNASCNFRLLLASPQVNGFYGAKGASGWIPTMYTWLARQFWEGLGPSRQHIEMAEYEHPGWTFHSKGLWYQAPGQPKPCLTLIGSPNFGHRSVHRDLEAQVAIVTGNPDLQEQLHQEYQRLWDRSRPVTQATFQASDRHVPLWVRWVTPLLRNLF
ncbi:CDP-diacylglycerol--glycerol-3-phosphate 3-phosphatidyltransferase, mitochondrial-like [Ornithodoros turicata]|uniref:CDP-diacylglycerol--glycerol-3-phosphate 3-phosphatidyltransferase, mitochondrial-like n=1 Tax=Ornithodoros turicata TaxID=34597 RepID=UPI003138EEEC